MSVCNRFSNTPITVTEYLGQTKDIVSQTIRLLEDCGLLEKLEADPDHINAAFNLSLEKIIKINLLKSFGTSKTCQYDSYSKETGHYCNLVKVKLGTKDV